MFSLRNGDYRVHVLPLPLHVYVVGYATLWIRPSWRRRHAFSKVGTTVLMSCLYLATISGRIRNLWGDPHVGQGMLCLKWRLPGTCLPSISPQLRGRICNPMIRPSWRMRHARSKATTGSAVAFVFPRKWDCRVTTDAGRHRGRATWLILPVVICLSQRLSHACASMNQFEL